MSGAEKLVFFLVAAGVRAALEASRSRGMAEESTYRQESANSYLAQMQALRRRELADRLTLAEQGLAGMRGELDLSAEQELSQAVGTIHSMLQSRNSEIGSIDERLVTLERRLTQSRQKSAQQAAQAANERSEQLRLRLKQIEERIAAVQESIDKQAEQQALADAREAIGKTRGPGASGDPVQQDFALRMAERSVAKLEHIVNLDEDRQRARHNEALSQLEEYEAIIAGLAADPTVMRWLPGNVGELQQQAAERRSKVEAGETAGLGLLRDAARSAEADLVARASAAQIKADQRDYIVDGIRSTLQEMGFMLGPTVAEHAGHPASAMLFSAVNDAGRGINVSVPVDGEIIYDIDGFPKNTVSKVGGGKSATCDEAQQVLEEMHEKLEEDFQVSAGELSWAGRDPDRILRRADELPGGGEQRDQERDR
jgi:hypothetical protein